MTTVLVVEHDPECPPAMVGDWLEDAGCRLDVCRPYAGDELPPLDGYDAFVILGGPMGASDDDLHDWLEPVKAMVRDAVERAMPTLGICLGHQLVAVALGGEVAPNPRGQQVGLLNVGWSHEAARDPLFATLATPRRGVQWNHDIVTRLPAGAVALAQTTAGELQAVRFTSTTWGIQLHPEVDGGHLVPWAASDLAEHQFRGIDQAALMTEIHAARDELVAAWQPLADALKKLAS